MEASVFEKLWQSYPEKMVAVVVKEGEKMRDYTDNGDGNVHTEEKRNKNKNWIMMIILKRTILRW